MRASALWEILFHKRVATAILPLSLRTIPALPLSAALPSGEKYLAAVVAALQQPCPWCLRVPPCVWIAGPGDCKVLRDAGS